MNENKSEEKRNFIFDFLIFLLVLSIYTSDLIAQNDTCRKEIRIGKIEISGNKKTKERIILRELTFRTGEVLCLKNLEKDVEQSKINLLKTPLFNFVTFEIDTRDSLIFDVLIKVEERWYLWPVFRIGYADPNLNAWLKTKDFSRLSLGVGIEKYNVRGANEHVILQGVWGYERLISLSYSDVYIDKKRQNALSFYVKNFNQRSVEYAVEENQLQNIKLIDRYAFTSFGWSIGLRMRKKIEFSHNIFLSWEKSAIADTVLKLNPDFFNGGFTVSEIFGLEYFIRWDKRDSRSYPLSGFYLSSNIKKLGFGFIKNSHIDYLTTQFKYSKHTPLVAGFYLANNIEIKKSFGRHQSFYMQDAFGYTTALRGFEYYIIKGYDFALMNTSLKYELISEQIIKLDFIPLKKFNKIHYALYLDFYFDTGYAYQKNQNLKRANNFNNTILYSGGMGLNFVTYYDLLIRLEYSINKIGEYGFFIHFETPF